MHILIIPTSYPNDYNPISNIFFRDQAEALSANGLKVGVLAIIPIPLKEIIKHKKLHFGLKNYENDGVVTYLFMFPALPKTDRLKQWLRKKIALWAFKKYKAKIGIPDILHVHTYKAAISAQAIKKTYNIQYVITEHSTAFARKLLSQEYGRPFSYVPNVVDTTFFLPSKKFNSKKSLRLLNIGYLEKKKQQDLLLFAFKKVTEDFKDIQLIIGGSGPEELSLKYLASELDLNSNVSFLGKLSREEVKEELLKCDIFVLSSKIETFGVVLIESLSCGKPVVATRSGGPESIIIDKKYGVLTENSIDGLSEGILEVVLNIKKYNLNEIRSYVENTFSKEAISRQLIKIYRQVLSC